MAGAQAPVFPPRNDAAGESPHQVRGRKSCQIMGIINMTPDSFYPESRCIEPAAAIARGIEMVEAGADILDVGGESTRPGASPVSDGEEMDRVLPVISALSVHARVSIDTRKESVAREAMKEGASIINDVSSSLSQVAADTQAVWIAMHMKGDPRNMQDAPSYTNVVDEVEQFLLDAAANAVISGVSEIWIDPGIGFGKTLEHNIELLKALPRFVAHGFPVLVGTSRKSFLGTLARECMCGEIPDPSMRLPGSLATAVWGAINGASVVRVHDVLATKHAFKLLDASYGSSLH